MAVHHRREGPITTVTIDRPRHRNAVDRDTADRLVDAFAAFEQDDEALVGVLTGAGGVFCAGADLKAVADGRPNRIDPGGDGPLGPTRRQLSKPVIAAVAGHAVAGGLELALWCDMRVVDETAVFGVFCRRWGVPLIDGGTVRLPRVVGLGRAMDMVLTGRPVGAEEALRIGLADRLVPAGEAVKAAQNLARELARFPQGCLRADRASVYGGIGQDLEAALRQEAKGGTAVLASESLAGARRFARGAGRHGAFETSES